MTAAPHPGDDAFACLSLLADELARGRLAGACIAPGSRSTPMVLALARHPGIRLHVHLDERAAGFFALGLAKTTGRPAAVVCTSGTAAANLLPAATEAHHAGVPLLLLTADRPPELRDTGAGQTIDQIKLYGTAVRWFVEAEVPLRRPGAARYWRSLGARAIGAAAGPPAGPVHLNLPLREPLVPSGESIASFDLDGDLDASRGREGGAAWEEISAATLRPSEADLDRLAAEIESTERGVLLAGALPPGALPPGAPPTGAPPTGGEPPEDGGFAALGALAEAAGWPLLAEPTSNLRRSGALSAPGSLLADPEFRAAHRPDLVLQVGSPPTDRPARALAAATRRLVVIDPAGAHPDPARWAAWSLRADPREIAAGVQERLRGSASGSRAAPRETEWVAAWRDADRRARAALDAVLDADDEPFEGRLARDLAAAVPDGGIVWAAASLPIRDLDLMAPREGLRILANRGANGIDGFVSTVLGSAAASAGPVYALCGDLALLHDAGGFLWAARRAPGAIFCVPNNGGGAIFDLLPSASLPEHEPLFVTPHGLDLGRLADAAGAGYLRAERAAELTPALAKAAAAGGTWLVEVPVDRAASLRRRRTITERVRAALGSPVGG